MTTCPTCGQPVRVVSGDEGTSHYEAATDPAPEVERLREALEDAIVTFHHLIADSEHRIAATRAALSATPAPAREAGLDVERLKRALAAVVSSPASLRRLRPTPDAFHTTARLIAAEYAAVAATPARQEEGA